jgi:hypothetical protein
MMSHEVLVDFLLTSRSNLILHPIDILPDFIVSWLGYGKATSALVSDRCKPEATPNAESPTVSSGRQHLFARHGELRGLLGCA